jgi:ABC-2 type transport system permease protein
MKTLRKYFRIFLIQLKNNFVREAVYRSNFLTMMVVDLVWIGVEFTLFSVIYANTPVLAGWTQPQVYFFLGIFFASDAVFTTLFQRNFWNFSDLVNKGELDILLTKPAHPLFLSLTRWMNLTAIFNLFLGVGIAIRYADEAGFSGGLRWGLLPLWLLFGVVSALLLRFAFSIWIFWTERSWALSRLYYQFFAFASKPDGLYPIAIRYSIMTFLPFAFIGSVPTRALLHGLTLNEYLGLASVLVFFFCFDAYFWKKGLARYQSASS